MTSEVVMRRYNSGAKIDSQNLNQILVIKECVPHIFKIYYRARIVTIT